MATGVFAFAVCWSISANAWAQRETGPFAGLFGGDRDREVKQTLAIRWSGYGGYDDTVLDQAIQLAADPRFQKSGTYGGLSLGLGYDRNAGRNRFSVDASSSVRAYGATGNISAPMYVASTGFDLAVAPRMSVHGSLSRSYASFYQFAPFLAADANGADPTYGFAAVSVRNVGTSAGAGISASLSSRTTLSANAGWNRSEFQRSEADGVGTGSLGSRNASFRFQSSVSRDLGFHAGYGYRDDRSGGVLASQIKVIVHDLDVGVDFNHALSVSRRTTVQFGTGSSMARSQDRVARYRLNGQASLTQGIGRTWTASLSYVRGSHFVQGLNDVAFSNTLSAAFGGLLATRLQFTASAGSSSGEVGLDPAAPRFGSYTGSGKLAFAVSHALATYVQYVYYRYNMPPGSSVGFGDLPPRLGRQALTFGLSGWVPLIKDTRSRRDSR